jgi:curved DNA-binding protein CbpA
MEAKDYYKVLGLELDASEEEIKKRYRTLAMQYHPDRNRNNPGAVETLKDINEAYHVLGNRERKSAYDRSLSTWTSNPPFRGAVYATDLDAFVQAFSRKPFGFRGRRACKGSGRGRCGKGRWAR